MGELSPGLGALAQQRRRRQMKHVSLLDAADLTWLTIKEFRQARGCDLRVLGSCELILRTNPGP
jgi:hypothetical protein